VLGVLEVRWVLVLEVLEVRWVLVLEVLEVLGCWCWRCEVRAEA
jgi:hypothetical protein